MLTSNHRFGQFAYVISKFRFAIVFGCVAFAGSTVQTTAGEPEPIAPSESITNGSLSERCLTYSPNTCDFYNGCDTCCSTGQLFRRTLFDWGDGSRYDSTPITDEPLVTDRPDFTEASSTVGAGVAQLEFGYTYTYDSGEGSSTRNQSFGEPLLRLGLHEDWLELRIGVAPLEERTRGGGQSETTAGVSDLYLGFKIGLTRQSGWLPEVAIIPQMNVPTGSSIFTSKQYEPGVNVIYGWEVSDCISTGGQTQVNQRVDDANDGYLEISQSWTIAYSLTNKWGAYSEWFAFFPHGAAVAQVEHYANGGFTYLINDDIQWDVRVGTGLNRAAADFFTGTGLSIRFH